MRALVTGAGGFIGRAVVRALAAGGCEVVAHVGPPGAELAVPPEAASALWFEIADAANAAAELRRCDAVVHLAGPAAVAPSFAEPRRYLLEHGAGTSALLVAARAAGVGRFVYVSSAEVYGRARAARVREDAPPRPRSPYAAAKLAAEALVGAAARTGGPSAFVLRPFSVYGPGQRPTSVLGTVLSHALAGEVVTVRDLAPVRDYCHVDDVARAVVRACAAPVAEVGVANVGTGVGTSVGALVAAVEACVGHPLPVRALGAERGPADIFRLVADPRHARRALGWEAAIGLSEGLAALVGERAA